MNTQLKEEITQALNQARCLSQRTVGNVELAETIMSIIAAHEAKQAQGEAEAVLAALASGEWKIEKLQPSRDLTDEANAERQWLVTRNSAPYRCADGHGVWLAGTALAALHKAQKALGLPIYTRPQKVEDARDAERRFPMLKGPSIPWSLAEAVYAGYSALYGKQQSLERLAERGGFSWAEVELIYNDRRPVVRQAIDAAIAAQKGGQS